MELLERDRHDHPDFDLFLPQIGCGICGRAVQTQPGDVGPPSAVRAAYQAPPEDEAAAELRRAFQAPMTAWSFAHAGQHTAEEHDARQRALEA